MKIKNNKIINNYFKKCFTNINNDDEINSFIDLEFSLEQEPIIQKKLHQLGFFEYYSDDSNLWPSLYYDIDQYLNTPYHQNISLASIKANDYELSQEIIPANKLINLSFLKDDPEKALNDTFILKAYNKPYNCVVLKQNDLLWMTDTPQEANTIDPYAQKAFGNVLNFGLGIGYFVYMACLNPKVKTITIIEYSKEVIDLFNKYLLPQFPQNKKITIIQGDAFHYFNQSFVEQFDYTFVDIYKSNEDGLITIAKMLDQYLPQYQQIDFWIESTCVELVRAMMLEFFYELMTNKFNNYDDPILNTIFLKMQGYFNEIPAVITTASELQEFLYNPMIIREILAYQLPKNV